MLSKKSENEFNGHGNGGGGRGNGAPSYAHTTWPTEGRTTHISRYKAASSAEGGIQHSCPYVMFLKSTQEIEAALILNCDCASSMSEC